MSNQQKKNTFYGAAAILTVSTILVKIIGAIFKIPLIAILPEEAYGVVLLSESMREEHKRLLRKRLEEGILPLL